MAGATKMSFKAIALITMALGIATPVAAGPLFEDGYAAAAREDYATAFRLWRQAAHQGDVNAHFLWGPCTPTAGAFRKTMLRH
jgi:hypothetical protein